MSPCHGIELLSLHFNFLTDTECKVQVGQETGMGKRINMVMQSVFFKLSGVMPFDQAIALLKKDIVKMYGNKGDKVVFSRMKSDLLCFCLDLDKVKISHLSCGLRQVCFASARIMLMSHRGQVVCACSHNYGAGTLPHTEPCLTSIFRRL